MRFLIKTTGQTWSDHPEEAAPCEAAKLQPITYRGKHRCGSGRGIDLPTERWFVEINTTEELMAIAEEVGNNLIIGPPSYHHFDGYEYEPALPEILIYDGFIE